MGKYYLGIATTLKCGIEDCSSTKCFSRENKLRFITWFQTMNNQISHLFTLTGMFIVNSVKKMTVKRVKRIQ